jgi:hypothetical protein
MVEDHVLWLRRLFFGVTKNRHKELGREGGWLLCKFLVSRVSQGVAVLR